MNFTKLYVNVENVFPQTVYLHNCYHGEKIMDKFKTVMELSYICSVNQAHTYYIMYTKEIMNGT